MKPQQLLFNVSKPSPRSLRPGGRFATVFAAALVLGLGVSSLFAQGPYYPQVNAATGGAPFDPNGVPVTSSAELNAIEGKLAATKTLITPLPAGKTAASAAEYAAAVKAVATDLANGVVIPGVSLGSLAAEVAKYRSAQTADALGALADGVIASGSGTKATQLSAAAAAAAAANPGDIGTPDYALFLNKIAADNALVGSVDSIVSSILTGAVSTSLGASVVQPASINTLLANAVSAVNAAPGANPATATNALKKALIEDVANSAIGSIIGTPSLVRDINLDQATAALTIPSATVNLSDMLVKIAAAVGVPTDNQAGAIAQGALRNAVNRNPAGYGIIKTAAGSLYVNDLVDSFSAFNSGAPGLAAGLVTGGKDPAAVAAAGALKFPGSAGAIVKDALIAAASPSSAVRQNIVARASAASQTSALAIAAANAAGFGGATPAEVAAGAITGAQIGSAGAIAKAVVNIPANLTNVVAPLIATAAVDAAEAASTPANKNDAIADIAYNMASVLKLAGGVGDARSSASVTAMVNALDTPAASFIPVIAALAGNGNANAAAIKAAGLAADVAVNAGGNATPINDGAALTASLLGFGPYNPLANYNATLNALSGPTTDSRNRALLYAASLANSSDAVGGLAAAIAKTSTNPAVLIQDAISANRLKQSNLALAGDVATFMKANGLGTDIQAYVGEKILSNPTMAEDVATAATVTLPNFAHYTAHAVGFNAPQQANQVVAAILNHSKVTFTSGVAGVDRLTTTDRPAAVAAITAGVVTGIIENRDLSAANKQIALRDAVRETVKTVVSTAWNDSAAGFRRSDGGVGTFTTSAGGSKGVAGAITGFVAQTTSAGNTTVSADVTAALTAAAAAVGSGGFNYDIAQAAGQAFGWVSGAANAAAVGGAGQAADQIAAAIFAGYGVGPTNTYAKIRNAVDFGLNEAAGGTGIPGAGARGLSSIPGQYYLHKSASGVPVSDIFSL